MPHLILEYSNNVTQSVDFPKLFQELHSILKDVGDIPLNNCKSRARVLPDFYVGDGADDHALVHLEIAFLSGRSADTKRAISEQALLTLERHYQESIPALALQLSVEMRDIERDSYSKFPKGTLGV